LARVRGLLMNEDQSIFNGPTNGVEKILFIESPLTMDKGIKE